MRTMGSFLLSLLSLLSLFRKDLRNSTDLPVPWAHLVTEEFY